MQKGFKKWCSDNLNIYALWCVCVCVLLKLEEVKCIVFVVLRCAELLVLKAELELMQGEREESAIDLDKVRNLLEICTGLSNVQFHPVK